MQELLQEVVRLALHSGNMIREDFYAPNGPRGYGGKAPVDVEIEQYLRDELRKLRPAWSILGEELPFEEGSDHQHCWILDPQDGTSAFHRGFRGSTVAIGLLRRNEPVLGVVYAPLYPNDRGDLIAGAQGVGLFRNGEPISPEPLTRPLSSSDVVVVSQDADHRIVPNIETLAPARYRAMPSVAYRLALAAVGEARAGMSLAPLRTLDVAASHALLKLSGRILRNLDDPDKPVVRYDGEANLHGVVGGDPAAVEQLTPWPWNSVFGPRNDTQLCEPLPRCAIGPDSGLVLERAQGCLLGQLAGDALGSLVEFKKGTVIRSLYPTGPLEMEDGGTWHTLAGQPTDDSELALALTRRLLKDGHFDPQKVRGAYQGWLESKPFDCGNTVGMGIMGAVNMESQANGSLMRCSPLGLAFGPEQLDEIAVQESELTHPNPLCGECCRIFTKSISRAIQGMARAQVLELALGEAQGEVRLWLETATTAPPKEYQKYMGWVKIAFSNAFYHLAQGTPLEQAVIATVRAGGDTDTNAAITGALLGAFQGFDAVPASWRRSILTCRPHPANKVSLRHRPDQYWPVDALILAERLLQLRLP